MRGILFPTVRQSQTSALIRLGRVVHWVSIAGALCVLVGGVSLTAGSISRASETHAEATAWDKAHEGRPGGMPPLGATAIPATDPDDTRPYESSAEYGFALAAAALALIAAMAGRGARYVLADE